MNTLRIRDLTYSIGDKTLLHGVTLDIAEGKAHALIGPNGAGKSTLLKILAGLRSDYEGSIQIGETAFDSLSGPACARMVHYIPQNISLTFPIQVLDSVLLGRIAQSGTFGEVSRVHRDEARALISAWGMERFATRDLRSLSDGERQKISIIRGVFQGSEVLLLDETLSSLDVDQQLECVERLRALIGPKKTMILVTHDLNLATEWGDAFVVMNRGKIIAQGEAEILSDLEMIRNLYPAARVERVQGFSGRTKFLFQREVRATLRE